MTCLRMKLSGSQIFFFLLLTQLDLATITAFTDCHENEYEDEHGNCVPCKQCGPGQELSEECGNEIEPYCVPCRPGRYKEDRGHHRCIRCLPCAIINRVLKANCTPTMNSVCGDCLPGFYSKTRIGGLQELECFPCTAHTPLTETQCHSRSGAGQPSSTSPPPARDPVVLMVIVLVALALILVALVTLSFVCCGRFFKSQCQRAFQRSQDFRGQHGSLAEGQEATQSPCEEQSIPSCCFGQSETCRQLQSPVEEVQAALDRDPSRAHTACNALQPSVELCTLPPAPIKPQYTRSVSETQPLIRNSGCSDCFSGGSSPTTDPNSVTSEPLNMQARSCASEKQHWSHAPVECTELDLQNLSADYFSSGSQPQFESTQESLKTTAPHTCICIDSGHSFPVEAETSRSTSRNPTQLTGVCEDLLTHLSNATLGLPISHIPDSLVISLGLQLDPSIPGLMDFRDVGAALGVPSQVMEDMNGFKALHSHLSSASSCTLFELVYTLQHLQRSDALSLISKHFNH
ncbi:tumor necrosis factor receptor superfamily member 27 isoform X2 [Bombina bombina]|uniref:tumor necrosis factor receptor superfamily member 27 isoform X2 n=1 Tax=Bombina bombina TaxID=8345 RepID=UPI00235AE850|nr:tumor necrosis factor receptor superfamily member 27 isoform X2 [Bombina bombina]